MRAVDIFTLLLAPILIGYGLVLFIKNPKNLQNIVMFSFLIVMGIWSFFLTMFQTPWFFDSMFWIKANYTISWLIFFTGIGIPLVFPKSLEIKLTNVQKFLSVSYIAIGPLIVQYYILFTDLFVVKVYDSPSGKIAEVGPAYLIWLFYLLPMLSVFYVKMFKKMTTLRGMDRLQFKYIFLGFVAWSVPAFIFNMLLPIWGIYQVWIGPAATFFIVISVSYAILRYRLLDINLVVRRGVIYSSLMTIIVVFYSVIILVIQRMFFGGLANNGAFIAAPQLTLGNLLATAVVVLTIDPLKRFIEKITDRYFFKSRVDTEEALMNLGKSLSSITSLEELSDSICSSLLSTLKLKSVRLVINEEEALYEVINHQIEKITLPKDVLEYLAVSDDLILFEELEGDLSSADEVTSKFTQERILLHYLNDNNSSAIVPLMRHNTLAGFILLGKKLSDDSLTITDISLLQTLAYQTAIAVDNALLYSEMEEKINQRTQQLSETNTKLQTVNEKLEEAYGELQVLDNAKSDFISMASHQLRTPVSVIRGYTSMLLEGDFGKLQDAQEHAVQLSLKSIKRLSEIIDDILNVSRIEGGKFALRKDKTNLAQLLHDVCLELDLKAKEKNLQLHVVLPDELKDLTLDIDKEKMVQVISNLVHNAINYTPSGSVTVTLGEDAHSAIVCVTDTGIGIPQEDKGKLFQRFSRLENAKAIRPDGTGIGLYLVKAIVDAHEGSITIESKEKEGSTFVVHLPRTESSLRPESNTIPENLTNNPEVRNEELLTA